MRVSSLIKVYLALGSNVDDPVMQLNWALERLRNLPNTQFRQVSQFRMTKPVGFLEQPDILNAVVELDTYLSARALLSEVLALEKERKRERSIKNGPRTLDIDILLYGEESINEPDLIIPHPRMWERDFVLIPLYEIAPHLKSQQREK